MQTDLDLYTDYLISSFGQTSSTGLSLLLDKVISHDDVTRFLNQSENDSQALWKQAKPIVRQIESDEGLLMLDDSLSEKPYTDANGLICPHFDHSSGTFVNGINFVSLLYFVSCSIATKVFKCRLDLPWLPKRYNPSSKPKKNAGVRRLQKMRCFGT
jgi:hypothetical protein